MTLSFRCTRGCHHHFERAVHLCNHHRSGAEWTGVFARADTEPGRKGQLRVSSAGLSRCWRDVWSHFLGRNVRACRNRVGLHFLLPHFDSGFENPNHLPYFLSPKSNYDEYFQVSHCAWCRDFSTTASVWTVRKGFDYNQIITPSKFRFADDAWRIMAFFFCTRSASVIRWSIKLILG